MKITYIHHSSFLIELEHCYLLFDYTEGDFPPLDGEKPLLVMASHRHGDHFSDRIFSLPVSGSRTYYLLSSDIKKLKIPEEKLSVTEFIKSRTETVYGIEQGFREEVRVETLKSTDEGVAFLVTTKGLCLYHAGDLNNWTWSGEPDGWNKNMQVNYRREIETLKGRAIDIAFLPLDPRQEADFYLGVDDFMTRVGAGKVFPMHMWSDFSVIGKLKELPSTAEYADRIVQIHEDGEVFTDGL